MRTGSTRREPGFPYLQIAKAAPGSTQIGECRVGRFNEQCSPVVGANALDPVRHPVSAPVLAPLA